MEQSVRTRPIGKGFLGVVGARLRRLATEMFARDAEEWGLTPRQALILAMTPIIVSIAVAATIRSPDLFLWLIDEDSLIENTQFALIFVASLLFGWISGRLFRTGRHGLGMLYALLTLGTFFVAGEEISWAQRVLGLRTPETLEAINWQHEISAHNIHGFHGPFIYAVMLGGLYGTVMPLLDLALRAGRRRRSAVTHLLVPPLCLVPAFFMPFGYRFARIVFRPEVAYRHRAFAITEFSEVTELCLYFAVLVFAALNLRRLRQEPG